MGIVWSVPHEALAANEVRCSQLGANCVCSEPLQSTSSAGYKTIFGYDFNPDDTNPATDKECTKATPSAPGSVLEDGAGFRYVVETSGPMFAALPNKSAAVAHLLRTKSSVEGNPAGGGQFIGVDIGYTNPNAPVQQIAFRGYKYYSSDYQLYRNPTCVNSSKVLQFGKDSTLSFLVSGVVADGPGPGTYENYGWTGMNIDGLNCCVQGPADPSVFGIYDESKINGKWMRYETVFTNVDTTGPTMTWKTYVKNVTDNLPEVKIIDSTLATPQGGGGNADWTSVQATTVKSKTVRLTQMFFDAFRRDNCTGFVGFTYLMAAAWNSIDPSHRIGAACEIEGGCGGGTVPAAPAKPTGLKLR